MHTVIGENRKKNQEQLIYDHLLSYVRESSPEEIINRFRALFIEGNYPEYEIKAALDQLAAVKKADQEFKFILNRCCHIPINHWRRQPQLQGAIPELVGLFENYPQGNSPGSSTARISMRRLRPLVQDFINSEQYLTLSRLAQVFSQTAEVNEKGGDQPLGGLISRYPYLYAHCMLGEESNYEQQQTVRQVQTERQRKFEVDLSQYVTYQVRRSQLARKYPPEKVARILKPQPNPTLLSDREMVVALKQFVGKVEGPYTHRDLAQSFLTQTTQTKSYEAYKHDLYEYLTGSIDPGYGQRKFNRQLCDLLKNSIPTSDGQKLSDFLVVRTCSQLLNFLVVESGPSPNHFVFVDLIANNGPARTVGLLLKIVLICRKVKPYLEKRLALLYNHYESCTRDTVQWLIEAFEHVNLALSINFGAVDLSLIT